MRIARVANSPGLSEQLLKSPAGARYGLPSWLPEGRTVIFACARHGLYHGWRALRLPPGSAVLVPAFTCDTVTEPLRLAGARLVFFGVREDLSPDLDHAAEAAARAAQRSGRRGHLTVRALLWYDYLGFPTAMAEVRRFCDERGLFCIEDSAHTLPGSENGDQGRPVGAWGDLAVFSIRKTLPVTNAGALVINNPALMPLTEPPWRRPGRLYAATLRGKETSLRQREEERESTAGARLARVARLRHIEYVRRLNSPRESVREATRNHLHDADIPLQRMARPFAPDELSLRVIRNVDLDEVSRIRRRNYRIYLRRIGELALFPRLPTGVLPLGFSIRVPDRDAFRLRLARRGVESTTHWPDWLLPSGARRGFDAARRLADTLLTLPCHQGLSSADVEFACGAVLESWNQKASGTRSLNRRRSGRA